MGFLDRFFGRKPEPAPVVYPQPQAAIALPRRPFIHKSALDDAGLRAGMWVVTRDSSVGILTACGMDAIAEVTLAKPDGTTRMTLSADDKPVPLVILSPLDNLRQAAIEEIPEPRRPSIETLRSLKYRMRSEL